MANKQLQEEFLLNLFSYHNIIRGIKWGCMKWEYHIVGMEKKKKKAKNLF
jgi:hypothetical protein